MVAKWNGMASALWLNEDEIRLRHCLADAAKAYDWKKTLDILTSYPDWVNVARLDGRSLYTPLHQAAHGNAPVQVVKKMIKMGGWRTLRNVDGETAADIARKKSHKRLVKLLSPVYKRYFSAETLDSIQKHFHAIIYNRAGELVEKYGLRLPQWEHPNCAKIKEVKLFARTTRE